MYESLTYILDLLCASTRMRRNRTRAFAIICSMVYTFRGQTPHPPDRSSSVGGRRATSPTQAHTTTFNSARVHMHFRARIETRRNSKRTVVPTGLERHSGHARGTGYSGHDAELAAALA